MPKIVDHEKRREQLAEAVWRVILRRGIAETTTREIAAETGWSTGVLAHYFKNKNEMLLYAIRLTLRRLRRHLKATIKDLSAPLDALQVLACSILPLDAELRAEGQLWVNFWGLAVTNPSMAKESNKAYDNLTDMMSKLMLGGQQSGDFRKDIDVTEEAHALATLIYGIVLQATLDPGEVDADRGPDLGARFGEQAHPSRGRGNPLTEADEDQQRTAGKEDPLPARNPLRLPVDDP